MKVSMRDFSSLTKVGLKGPGAAEWLSAQGLGVPPTPNTWGLFESGGLIARLAETEFFIEEGPAARLTALLDDPPAGVYPVPRQDMCIALVGDDMHEVLRQTCSIDFQSDGWSQRVFMTSMIGVGVLAIIQRLDGAPAMRIWADPTFGPYVQDTFSRIIAELGGEAQ